MSLDRLLTLTQLADTWGWSRSKLHRLVAAKRIPHLRIGDRRDVYFEEEVVEQWLALQRIAAAGKEADRSTAPRRSARTVEEECAALGVEVNPAFL